MNICRLAISILVVSAINMATLLINFRNIGNMQLENFYLLALFSSINYLILSGSESFRATVISSSSFLSGSANASKFLNSIMFFSAILFIAFGMIVFIFQYPLIVFLNIELENQHAFIYYTLSMIYVSIVGCWSYIVLSLFYSMRKANASLILIVIAAFINITFTYFFAEHFKMGIYGIPVGILISASFSMMIGYYYLISSKLIIWTYPLFDKESLTQCAKNLLNSGLPVFLSYLAIFVGVFIFNGILSQISLLAVSGYGVAYRIQTCLILPAIAIGVASAIYINEGIAKKDYMMAYKNLFKGVFLSFIIYFIIATITYFYRDIIVSFIVHDASIHAEAVRYLLIVSPSYIFFGPFVSFIIISEQTGNGALGLLLNSLYFIVAVSASYVLVRWLHQSSALYACISSINVLAFLSIFVHKKKILNIDMNNSKEFFYVNANKSAS